MSQIVTGLIGLIFGFVYGTYTLVELDRDRVQQGFMEVGDDLYVIRRVEREVSSVAQD